MQQRHVITHENIANIMSSPIAMQMKSLFKSNPDLVDTMDGIARRMGLPKDKIESDVFSLMNLGVIKTRYLGTTPVLYLDKKKIEEIDSISAKILFAGKVPISSGEKLV